eukprot:g25839.t1
MVQWQTAGARRHFWRCKRGAFLLRCGLTTGTDGGLASFLQRACPELVFQLMVSFLFSLRGGRKTSSVPWRDAPPVMGAAPSCCESHAADPPVEPVHTLSSFATPRRGQDSDVSRVGIREDSKVRRSFLLEKKLVSTLRGLGRLWRGSPIDLPQEEKIKLWHDAMSVSEFDALPCKELDKSASLPRLRHAPRATCFAVFLCQGCFLVSYLAHQGDLEIPRFIVADQLEEHPALLADHIRWDVSNPGGTYNWDVPYSQWGTILAPAVSLVPFLLAPYASQAQVCFLDVACIHQADDHLKERGIYGLGGFLKASKELRILWSPPYLSRLWCIFELGAYRMANPSGTISIKPLFVEVTVLACWLGIQLINLLWVLAVALTGDLAEWYGGPEAFTEYVRGPLHQELISANVRHVRQLVLGLYVCWFALMIQLAFFLCDRFAKPWPCLDWLQTILIFLFFAVVCASGLQLGVIASDFGPGSALLWFWVVATTLWLTRGGLQLGTPESLCHSEPRLFDTHDLRRRAEHLGKKLNLHWGEFDDSLRCRNASRCHQTLPIYRDCCWPRKTTACSLWHYPPSADAHLAAVYAQCSTFGVVRDPLRRFVSQYFWITKAHHEPGPLCDREKFEAYANRTLQRLLEDPWIEDCHLVPQVPLGMAVSEPSRQFPLEHGARSKLVECTLAVMFSALTAGSLFHALRGKARTFGQHMEQRNDFLNLTKETMLFAKNHTNATRRCLKFIHIPKNAGSAIENLGYHLKYAWGLHDHSLHCLNASECSQTVPVRRLCCWPNNVTACSVWHYPPRMDEELTQNYANCSTFCVVRDPLRRFVSEYFYISKQRHTPGPRAEAPHPKAGPLCNQRTFEEYANATLQRLMIDPWIDDCHHVDLKRTKLPAGVNSVRGRCKMENLSVSEHLQQRLRDFFHLDYQWGLGS